MLIPVESLLKAIGDRSRLRILKMLEPGELCVCQMTAVLGLGTSTVSQHLFILKSSGLVQERRQGRWTYYSLAKPRTGETSAVMLEALGRILNDDETVADDRRKLDVLRCCSVADVRKLGSAVFAGAGRSEAKGVSE